jgi:hypothetical protein
MRAQQGEKFLLSRAVVVGVHRNQEVTAFPRRRFRTANDSREKRNRHVGNDDSQSQCLTGLQASGDMVRMIVQLANRGLHLQAKFVAYRHRARDDVGYGPHRHACQFRDFLDARHEACCKPLLQKV